MAVFLKIPFRTNQGVDDFLELTPFSNNASIERVVDAEDNGESPYQLIEGAEYEYYFENSNYQFKEEPNIIFWSQSRNHPSSGKLRTGLYVGTLCLQVVDRSSREDVAKIYLEIRSVKSTYREDYRQMMGDITQHYVELVMLQSSPIKQNFEIDFDSIKDPNTLYQRFAFVKSIIENDIISIAISKIEQSPIRRWTETTAMRPITNIRRLSQKNVRQIITSNRRVAVNPNEYGLPKELNSLPTHIEVPYKKDTIDTLENRFIKYVLVSFFQFCSSLRDKKKASDRLKSEASSVCASLERLLSHSFFREVSMPQFLNCNSPVLQRKEGYREILQSWIMFDLAAKLSWKGGDNVFYAGKRNVAALYEYWLFFKLFDIVSNLFTLKQKSIEDLIEKDDDQINLGLKQGRCLKIEGEYNSKIRKLNVEFYYNRTFRASEDYGKSGSWTIDMRPDYTITFWSGDITLAEAEEQNLVVHIHFDAKYRIDQILEVNSYRKNMEDETLSEILNDEKEQEESGIYKRADILKMHAYKDAIRRTGGAYVLYPGSKDAMLPMNGFHEIIPGLGAFCLRPGDDNGIAELRKFIVEVLEHFLDRSSSRERLATHTHEIYEQELNNDSVLCEILPESNGDNRFFIPDETVVIFGLCKSEKHLDWISEHGAYNYRANRKGSFPITQELASAKYILLHDGHNSLGLYKLSPNGPVIRTRDDLLKDYYPRESKEIELQKQGNIYLVYKIDFEGTESEYKDYQWRIKDLKADNADGSHGSAFISPMRLTDLILKKKRK